MSFWAMVSPCKACRSKVSREAPTVSLLCRCRSSRCSSVRFLDVFPVHLQRGVKRRPEGNFKQILELPSLLDPSSKDLSLSPQAALAASNSVLKYHKLKTGPFCLSPSYAVWHGLERALWGKAIPIRASPALIHSAVSDCIWQCLRRLVF